MKTFTTLFFSLLSFITFSQSVSYSDVENGIVTKGSFDSYTSKDGTLYTIGDQVNFGMPSGTNGKFVTIKKMDIAGTLYIVGAEILNTSAQIKKIRVSGTKRSGYKVSFQTKGMTAVDNYFFNIEDAITVGEVDSEGMTSDEALVELKKAKDKLDLGLITQEEFDEIKEDLSKYIK